MSDENKNDEVDTCEVDTSYCASCGVAEVDDIKLKDCDGCDLVKYCSDECQEDHKSEHEEECKTRAAELRDEILFKQPESSHMGDCPICCLPIPHDHSKHAMNGCCSKIICKGCVFANAKREREMRLALKCPFCRKVLPEDDERYKLMMKRVEMNCPVATREAAVLLNWNGDYGRAFELFTKAAELGDVASHFELAVLYHNGEGVEKDMEKYIQHLEEAAIGGHYQARYNLGCDELRADNFERAVKHWIIAAAQGDDGSIKALMKAFRGGYVSKEDLDVAFRAHKAAIDATKSPQRDEADRLEGRV